MQRNYFHEDSHSKGDRLKSKSTLSLLFEEIMGPPFDLQGFMESFNSDQVVDINIDESGELEQNPQLSKPHLTDSGTSSLNEDDQSFMADKEGVIAQSSVKNIVHKFSECSPNHMNLPIEREKWHLVVRELIDTEIDYLKSLQEIENGYLKTLNKTFSDDEEVVLIFSNWNKLREFHSQFLIKIKSINSYDFNEMRQLSQCFMDEMEQFETLYSEYCTNYSQSIKHLHHIEAISSDTWKSLTQCQAQLGHQLPLSTFLLKPVQRILKYHLLLKELIQCCKLMQHINVSEIVECLLKALEKMLQVVNDINNKQMEKEEQMRRLHLRDELNADIISSMFNCPDLGPPYLDGELKVPGCKNSRLVLLCENALILAKRLGNGKWDIKQIIKCNQMVLFEYIPKQPLEFHVGDITDSKNKAILQVFSAEEKENWCKTIKQLILSTFQAASITERAKRILLDTKHNVLSQNQPVTDELLDKFNFSLKKEDRFLDFESSYKLNILDPLSNFSNISTKKVIKRRNSVGAIKSESRINYRDPSIYQWSTRRKYINDDNDEDVDYRSITIDINEENLNSKNGEGKSICEEMCKHYSDKSRTKTRLTQEDIHEILLPLHRMQESTDTSGILISEMELASLCSDQDLDSISSDQPINGFHKRKTTSMDRNFGISLHQKANSFTNNIDTGNPSFGEFPNNSQRKKMLFSSVRETKTMRSNSDWGSLFEGETKAGLVKRIFKASVKLTKRDKHKPNSGQFEQSTKLLDPNHPYYNNNHLNSCETKRIINKSNSIDYIGHSINHIKVSHSKKKKKAPSIPPSVENLDDEEDSKSEIQCDGSDPPMKPPRYLQQCRLDIFDRSKSRSDDVLKTNLGNHIKLVDATETVSLSQTSNSELTTPAKVRDLMLIFQSNR